MASFSSTAFDQSAFSVLAWDFGSAPPPAPPQTGGHFGFDEKKRKKRWDDEQERENRKQTLRVALFGLPPEVREEITVAPERAIEQASVNYVDYSELLDKIQALARNLDQYQRNRLDEQDENDIIELVTMGLI